ncbi:hypothetical protein ACFV16_22045 [Streptomyces massasporeus]|uniref:hypothetical protein n=1 Tax=Streptomyces massasporeus TaxID=67324 RepID=UPI00367B51BB
MSQRTEPREGEPEDAAQQRLDSELEVRLWRVPGQAEPEAVELEEGAPWWWHGDEDASQQFLAAQGVVL